MRHIKIYEDYSKDNYTNATIEPHEALHWMHDQNFTPLSSSVAVIRNGADVYLLDEIVLISAVSSFLKNNKSPSCKLFKWCKVVFTSPIVTCNSNFASPTAAAKSARHLRSDSSLPSPLDTRLLSNSRTGFKVA